MIMEVSTGAINVNVGTATDPERELFEDLRNKTDSYGESSMHCSMAYCEYVVLTLGISLLFVVIFVIITTTIRKTVNTVCAKKKERGTERNLDNRTEKRTETSSGRRNDRNKSIEITYEEPAAWKDDRSDAIKMEPNTAYAKPSAKHLLQ